jgi:hypothetical protein
VVYAGAAGLVLEPTAGKDKAKIKARWTGLQAGGSTAGGEGWRSPTQGARKRRSMAASTASSRDRRRLQCRRDPVSEQLYKDMVAEARESDVLADYASASAKATTTTR